LVKELSPHDKVIVRADAFYERAGIALLIYIGKRSPTADAIGLPFILAQS
jgi:hypothetical protein